MNFTDILGAMVQSGMSKSGKERITHALGGGKKHSAGPADILGSLGKMLGGSGSGGGGGLGDILGNVLGGASTGQGGSSKLAVGGLGALAGAILGGGKSSARGAVGGGTLAMLASLAFSALSKHTKASPAQVPLGLLEPETPEQQQQLENDAELIVRAMINAAKADGKIDTVEMKNIIGRLDDDGLTQEEKDFLIAEAGRPSDLAAIVSAVAKRPDIAAQIYSASLLAIDIDTVAEQEYMSNLADALGLEREVVGYLEKMVGL
jgi:uncharacterized membrane protein YebE (DUF533 family)